MEWASSLSVIRLLFFFEVFKLFDFVFGPFFENVFSPKGWQKNSQNCKIPKCSDLIDGLMVLPISIWKFDATTYKNTPNAFQHVPDLFWRLRDRKTRKHTKPKKIKTCPAKKQLGLLRPISLFLSPESRYTSYCRGANTRSSPFLLGARALATNTAAPSGAKSCAGLEK